jgi:hypothetical protein
MASAYNHDGLAACVGRSNSGVCANAIDAFVTRFERVANLFAWFTLIPGLIGVLLAAPLVFDLENGTYRLAWTQSITRRHWITTRFLTVVVASLVASLVMTLMMTWWHTPLDRLDGRMNNSVFDSEGIVVFGYTLFGLGLALAAGAVWRRTVPAVIAAFAGYLVARIFVDTWLRQRFVTPLGATWRSFSGPHSTRGAGAPANLNHAWVITQYPSDKLGHALPFPRGCFGGADPVKAVIQHCLAQHGGGYSHVVYQPASRFWELQGIETSIFAGTALVLILFAAWWTHQRTA